MVGRHSLPKKKFAQASSSKSLGEALKRDESDYGLLSNELSRSMESRLGGCPLILSVLGHLALLAAEGRDFSLLPQESSGAARFEHLRDPGSYRACLRQVCNANCDALRRAHENMKLVGMKLSAVPEEMAEALELLAAGSAEDVEALLPINLENLEDCAKVGKDKILEVVEALRGVMLLLSEMAEACESARGGTQVRGTVVFFCLRPRLHSSGTGRLLLLLLLLLFKFCTGFTCSF